jgi:hypothetical protein
MTPQQISDYKMRWMRDSAILVQVHSDWSEEAKAWCLDNLNKWEWKLKEWTDVYEHTFYFENKLFAKEFAKFLDN